jgi:hypothetical protein
MGYYNYQSGLIYRHLDQSGGWDSHLERCRSFILKALDDHKPEKITVLGSGWLLELPLAEMAEITPKICLSDIVHPPEVLSQINCFSNVELSESDITGGLIDEVWQKTRKNSFFKKLKTLDDIMIPEFKAETDPGFVISLNILTQLESLLVDFLRKKTSVREEDYNRFRSQIQKKHIDFLKKHNSILITDYAEVTTNNKGIITSVDTLMTDLPPYSLKEEWTWNFDQTGSDFYNSRSLMKVIALVI